MRSALVHWISKCNSPNAILFFTHKIHDDKMLKISSISIFTISFFQYCDDTIKQFTKKSIDDRIPKFQNSSSKNSYHQFFYRYKNIKEKKFFYEMVKHSPQHFLLTSIIVFPRFSLLIASRVADGAGNGTIIKTFVRSNLERVIHCRKYLLVVTTWPWKSCSSHGSSKGRFC